MGQRVAPARRQRWTAAGSEWRAVTCGTPTERRLLRAYLTLFLVPADPEGARSVPLVRFGSYEVRLIEVHDLANDIPPLWIELYAHNDATTLDSCGHYELDSAVTAADHLMARARELHARSLRPWAGHDSEPLIG
jgi:hypothetical protein